MNTTKKPPEKQNFSVKKDKYNSIINQKNIDISTLVAENNKLRKDLKYTSESVNLRYESLHERFIREEAKIKFLISDINRLRFENDELLKKVLSDKILLSKYRKVQDHDSQTISDLEKQLSFITNEVGFEIQSRNTIICDLRYIITDLQQKMRVLLGDTEVPLDNKVSLETITKVPLETITEVPLDTKVPLETITEVPLETITEVLVESKTPLTPEVPLDNISGEETPIEINVPSDNQSSYFSWSRWF